MFELTSPEVAESLERVPIAVIPFGSVEQHGPHLPCGTDSIAAELVARALAPRLGALHVPFSPYGVTPLHAGHPGTVSLPPTTFEALLFDVGREVAEMGARTLIFVNWHELNTPSLDAVALRLQDEIGVRVFVAQACYVARDLYAKDGGTLTHAGAIEAMAMLAHDPALVKLDRAGNPSRPPGAEETDEMRRAHDVYGFVTDVTEIAPDGWYGDPGWATPERAETFPDAVVDEIVERLRKIGAVEEAES